ncbi:FAD-dependent oxidoreductase [Leptolyngbya sp. NIES-2104]|uniref:FAD-dependent oxidoreductase n=1 Tax=Leptolyngbya sp. NIES-2104 TaxID=1552121 RepID=UPI0006EC718C|nr:NAD(P)/FAD-dependent oxidoreductase [Leptolyngbya sp. NIES-2104]GAP96328.1 mercuric ion reductase [Leptolyngbya sp. NIES-2104]
MPADYDFVIIGYSETGIYAATEAARKRARVALVEQNCQPKVSCSRILSQFAKTIAQSSRSCFDADVKLRLDSVNRYTTAIAQSHQEFYDRAKLEGLGIEFIPGSGEFCRKPQTGFTVKGRILRSRAYLIATDYTPIVSEMVSASGVEFLTPSSVITKIPESIVIIGDDAIGVEFAQLYARLGAQVTMLIRQPHLLSMADLETAFLVQAALEAEGIRIINTLHIREVRQSGNKKRIEIENYAIETDELLITAGWQQNVSSLNLQALEIDSPIQLNDRLQTSHPRVYWITHPVQSIARYQTDIVLKNLSSLPIYKVDYDRVVQSVATDPEFAWIGLTETQAIRRYRRDVMILRLPFNALMQAQITGATTGLLKLIVRRNGQILGAHLVGENAIELIHLISLAMSENLRVQFFDRFSYASPAFSEILRNAAHEYRKLQRNDFLQDLQESYFAWQRGRTNLDERR